MINRISLAPKDIKNIYLSVHDANPPVNVTITEGTVNLSLSKALLVETTEKRTNVALKAGDSIVVRAPDIRLRNTGVTIAKCEFAVISDQ